MYAIKFSEITIKKSSDLLSNQNEFYNVLKSVIRIWKFSTEHNLTDSNINKRAWLGRAACCFKYGASINETRIAWHQLSTDMQDEANAIAEKIITEWESSKKQCQKTIWE